MSGWKLSVGFTFPNEGFRVYIPIGISSPVESKHQPTFLTQQPLSTPRPAPRWLVSLGSTHSTQPFVGQEGRPWAPLPTGSHGLSLLPPLPFFGVRLFFFLMMVVNVSKVSPALLLPWPPCQGLVSSSVTKAALDLDSLGREVAGSGS